MCGEMRINCLQISLKYLNLLLRGYRTNFVRLPRDGIAGLSRATLDMLVATQSSSVGWVNTMDIIRKFQC
jgi:hypothetical protein